MIQAKKRIEEIAGKEGLSGIATGFDSLDKVTSGWQPSDLIIIAARPGMGKTSLALDIARNVALRENKPVGIFSLEMGKDQLADRLIASTGNIDAWHLRTGQLKDDDFSRIQQYLYHVFRLKQLFFRIMDVLVQQLF